MTEKQLVAKAKKLGYTLDYHEEGGHVTHIKSGNEVVSFTSYSDTNVNCCGLKDVGSFTYLLGDDDDYPLDKKEEIYSQLLELLIAASFVCMHNSHDDGKIGREMIQFTIIDNDMGKHIKKALELIPGKFALLAEWKNSNTRNVIYMYGSI